MRSDIGLLDKRFAYAAVYADAAYAGPHLLAVADGAVGGGLAFAELASSAVIDAMAALDVERPPAELVDALAQGVATANMRLEEMIISDPATGGTTTLTALLWSEGHAALCHIGNTRAYLLRDGNFYQLTHDHTLSQLLDEEGRLTEWVATHPQRSMFVRAVEEGGFTEEVATHPQLSKLVRALDGRSRADPDFDTHESQAGDRYLLCSDGLSGVVTEQALHQALAAIQDPDKAARQLVGLALQGGGVDNITCIVADVVDTRIRSRYSRVPVAGGAARLGDSDRHLRSAASQQARPVDIPWLTADTHAVPPPDRLRPGDPPQVGAYKLLGRLGAGGMGQVFLGTSPGGRLVAIKILHTHCAADDDYRARFKREVTSARRVSGFYTAAVIDADPDASPPWLATAYVAGPSLSRAIASHGPFADAAVCRLGAALAESLTAIHACGLVHRDLKPDNIVLSADGPRVIDFGIARVLDGTMMTVPGTLIGTYRFMSPEQVSGQPVGPESDIFSLGSVLTFAATGHGPFEAPVPAIIRSIAEQPPNLDGIPSGPLRDVITSCLEKTPSRRPTLSEILRRLASS